MMLSVKNLRASRVNLIGNDFVSGLPSPFAFLGLAASIAPRFGAERWGVGVLPVIHSVDVSDGRTKGEQVRDGKGWKTIEIPEDIRGTVTFSLIIDFGEDAYVDEAELAGIIGSSRFAGGAIFPVSGRRIDTDTVLDGSALRTFRRGRSLVPVEGKPVAYGYDDDLMSLAQAVFPENAEDRTGWLVPSAVGYRMIGEPTLARGNVRDQDVPHVFAEPVAGVAELVSPRNARLSGLDDRGLRDVMWRYATKPGRVAAHSFYL